MQSFPVKFWAATPQEAELNERIFGDRCHLPGGRNHFSLVGLVRGKISKMKGISMRFTVLAVSAASLLLVTACAREKEQVVMTQQTPVYAKDGTIVRMEPTVTLGGGSSSAGGTPLTGGINDTGSATNVDTALDEATDGDDSDSDG